MLFDEDVFVPDTVPTNWSGSQEDIPMWPGYCGECNTEQVEMVASFDENFNIAAYELTVKCSWCFKKYKLPLPLDRHS